LAKGCKPKASKVLNYFLLLRIVVLKYRAEIDGLRALAVVPVILFHAGFELFSGGFVGVDVFFVISGYLITTILIDDIENNRFSIVNFYERRVRRILPALFFVMLACIPFAWVWMLPSQMKDFSQSLVAVSLFASNIFFWRESGYFSDAVLEKPLLHTWSLAVEQQYYVLFPIFLFLAWRFGKNRVFWMIVVFTAISLALSEWCWRNKAIANFYLAPTRAWEFFSGSIAAFVIQKRGVQSNNSLSLLGLAAIVFSIFAYDKNTPFPSIYALVPVVGVVLLVLFAEKETLTAKILSTKYFIGIGLISYSAYLWHQPLFAYARVYLRTEIKAHEFIPLIGLTLLLAFLSWKFIEKPFRDKSRITRRSILIVSLVSLSIYIVIGLLGYYQNGFQSRLKIIADARDKSFMEAVMKEWNFSSYPVHPLMKWDDDNKVHHFDGNNEKSVLLIGNSHALQYWYGFGEYFSDRTRSNTSKSLVMINRPFPPSIDNIMLPKSTDTVVLSYFWSLLYGNNNVNTYIRCCGAGPNGVVGQRNLTKTTDEMDALDSSLKEFVGVLKKRGLKVVFVLDNPFGEELNPQSMVELKQLTVYPTKYLSKNLSKETTIERSEPARSRLLSIAKDFNVDVIDPIEFLCDAKNCPKFSEDGHLLYRDYDHLSVEATKSNTSYIFRIVEP
jgi:peptidoglycan/LPS O-acetylase OafA/YrhL